MLFFMVLSILSCKNTPDLPEGFNVENWKKDKEGCLGFRETQVTMLLNMRDDFTGITESQVANLIGKPNYSELGKSKIQKYRYRLSPSEHCAQKKGNGLSKVLQIEFESLGRVRLMTIQYIRD